MTAPAWSVNGHYYECCNCDLFCPCLLQQMSVKPTKGICNFAMAFRIEKGSYESTSLNGLAFVVLGFTPEEMIKGNWSVGLVIDDRATPEQRDAIAAIASGAAGGPMASVSGLIGNFLGVESAPIKFATDGATWSVTSGDKIEIAGQALMGVNPEATSPIQLSNTGHPAANVLTMSRPTRSHVAALGLSWSDMSGTNSGLNAPFSWRSA